MRTKYNDYLAETPDAEEEDPEAQLESMDDIMSWYKERISNYVGEIKSKDEFRAVMTRVTTQFVQLVRVFFLAAIW